MDELELFIKRVLLENAIKYDGTTKANAAMGAVMREYPQYRGDAKTIMPIAVKVAKEINDLSLEQQQQKLADLGGSDAPEKEQKDPFDLETTNAILRFEPSPSGPMHIGHAYSLGLNHLLAARNDAKLILRIADTNPDNIYEPAYELLEEDAVWYTHDNISEVAIQSDRMELYYTYAEKLLSQANAYICTCEAEESRENLKNKTACECRKLPVVEHIQRWELMRTSWQPGDAVMRLKTDVTHKNPAMRDFPLMRIHHGNHPRQDNKYTVWPLMNFSVTVDDIEMEMTHVLRAKDHADNAKRQEYLYEYLNKTPPETYFVGKINFTDLKLSTSKTRKLIEEGVYTGWDDIRLPFLGALKRRGYQAEAFLKFADEVGITQTDKTVSKQEYFSQINAFNKEIIEKDANRAFVVKDPTLISIQDAPKLTITKEKNPYTDKGVRTIVTNGSFYVDKNDIDDPEGVLFRLIDAYNFKKQGDEWVFVSEDIEDFKQAKNKRIIHYVPEEDAVSINLLCEDGDLHACKAEASIQEYREDDILQFERVGFARLDNEQTMTFWFAHD